MPCYHPLWRVEDLSKWETAKDGHKYHPASIINDEKFRAEFMDNHTDNQQKYMYHNWIQIPCGKCIGCRLEYSRDWATRGYLESKLYKQNYFVTITYDDEFLTTYEEITTPIKLIEIKQDKKHRPIYKETGGITYWSDEWNGTLVPPELTQFIKNVRQIMKRDYNQDGIRFMAAGEYGDEKNTARPHYHIIFFNLNLPLDSFYDPYVIHDNVYWKNIIIDRAWAYKGITNISEATWNDIAYTARYITKKINGPTSDDEYASKGQEKEFFRSSRMPGIGKPYFDKHWKEIYKNDEVIIKNAQGVVRTQPPKYFDRLFEQMQPERFKEIKENRKKRAKNTRKIKDLTTSISRLEQLKIEERLHEERAMKLVREFERKGT